MLKGYLTYTLASLAVIGAFAGYFLGWVEADKVVEIMWAGLTAFGLRRAIQK